MDNKYLVSIIVPAYNVENYIERCILSIINQEYINIELLIIDDGSSDKTFEICQHYMEKDKRIRLIRKENEGVSKARNEGLKYVNGDYLLFVDSDDWLKKETIAELVKKILLYDADVVIYGWLCEGIINCSKKIVERDCVLKYSKIISEIIFDNEIYGGGYVFNKFWNYKKLKKNFRNFNENLYAYEDKLWNIENFLCTKKILLIPNEYYYYNVHYNSLSHQSKVSWGLMDNIVEAYLYIYQAVKEYEDLAKIAKEKYFFEVMEVLGTALKQKDKNHLRKYAKIFNANLFVILKSKKINIKYKCKAIIIYILISILKS